MRQILLIGMLFFTILSTHAQVQVWQKWTQHFTSEKGYENPYADISIKIKFTGPDNLTYSTYGYWTGDQTYAVSFSFPFEGKWKWSLTCSDTQNKSLHRKSGVVNVKKYQGSNPLYRNGFLKVSENNRYLTFNNGTPFLWMGCTAWAGPSNSTIEEWKEYIHDRVEKQFTVIQVTPFQKWNKSNGKMPEKNRKGDEPFLNYYTRLQPAFWNDLAEKVDYANQQGLVVAVTGLPGWQFFFNNPTERIIFAQYITGLFAGNFVIFSPSGDKSYTVESDYLAMEIDSIDSRHLITQHPDTPTGKSTNTASELYYDKPYLDFSMCQSGHNYGKSDICVWNAIYWNLSLYNRKPHKPVINTESYYHGNPNASQAHYRGSDTDVRSLGWYSWLSGSLGYTYGSLGLWNWGLTVGNVFVPWKEAIELNSSFQMKYMSAFFSKLNWWELEPFSHAILNQTTDTLKQMVLAKNETGTLAVAYIPANMNIEIDMTIMSSSVDLQWFNPRENVFSKVRLEVENKGSHQFVPPSDVDKDWVLLMQSK